MHTTKHYGAGLAAGALLGLGLHGVTAPAGATEPGVRPGPAEVRSQYGEPLRARVPLALPGGVRLDAVSVALADHARFSALGLDRDQIAQPIRVSLDPGASPAGPYVVLETDGSLREPALALVLEVRTHGQAAYHVVDVVLDGPAPLAAATSTARARSGAPDLTPTPVSGPPTTEPPVRRAAGGPGMIQYGPTGRHDTLYGIAAQVRPDRSVSVRDMAMAIFHANPHAFFGDNINNLKRGVVLNVPGPGPGGAFPDAEREFDRMMQAWRGKGPQGVREPSAVVGAAHPGPAEPSAQTPLRAPVAAAGPADAGSQRPRPAGEASTSSGLDASNAELRSRMDRLDQRITAIRQLLDRHDARVEALQSQAARIEVLAQAVAPRAEEGLTLAPVRSGVGGIAMVAAAAASERAPVASAAAQAETDPKATVAAPAGSQDRAVSRPVPPPSATVDTSLTAFVSGALRELLATLPGKALAAVSGLVVVGLIGWLVATRLTRRARRVIDDRRYEKREAGLRSRVSQKAAKAVDLTLTTGGPVTGRSSRATHRRNGESAGADRVPSGREGPELAVGATGEPMQALFREVDVYVAYGRFDDAVSRLEEAIEESPGERVLAVKLAEVLFEAGDVGGFVALGKSVHPRLRDEGELWARIAWLGRRLAPEERVFEQAPADAGLAETAGLAHRAAYEGRVDELAERRSRRV